MTDDELLQKLYEGTLLPQEQSDLDARMAASPEFAAEAQEFLAVVQLLDNDKKDEREDTAFLETTREKVTALIAAASAAGIGSTVVQSGSGGMLTAKLTQWLVGIIGVAGVGGVIAWNTWFTPSSSTQPAAVVQDAQVQTETVAPPVGEQPIAAEQRREEAVLHADERTVGQSTKNDIPVPRETRQQHVTPATAPRQPVAEAAQDNGIHRNTIEVTPSDTSPKEVAEARDKGNMKINEEDSNHNYETELAHFKERLNQERILKNTRGEAKVLLDVALTELLMKRYDDALFHAEASLALWQQLGEQVGMARAYRQLGSIYREMNRLDDAVTALTQGIAIAHAHDADEQKGILLGELAKVFELQGDVNLAHEKMYAAVVLLRKTSSSSLSVWERELQRLTVIKK